MSFAIGVTEGSPGTHNDTGQGRDLMQECRERVRYTLPSTGFIEDGSSGGPCQLEHRSIGLLDVEVPVTVACNPVL